MLKHRSGLLLPVLLLFLLPAQVAQARAVTVAITTTEAPKNTEVTVPVQVRDCEGLSGLSFNLRYDPEVLQFVELTAGPLLQQGLLEHQLEEPGLLQVDLLPDQTITGDGELLTIRFRAAGAAGATSELALEQLLAADDATREMLVTAEQGQITVRPANPGLLDVLIGLLVLGGIVFLVWQLMRRRTARSPRPPLAPEPAPAPSARTDAEPADCVSRE